MDGIDLNLNMPAMLEVKNLIPPDARVGNKAVNLEEERQMQVAKDFESIFVHQLLDVMKNTIPESDMEDGASKQIKSMYWSFMAEAVSDGGGMGMWEQIYEQMPKGSLAKAAQETQPQQSSHSLDESI